MPMRSFSVTRMRPVANRVSITRNTPTVRPIAWSTMPSKRTS